MESKSLLNESFYADPWTPETPSEDGDLWQSRLNNENSVRDNKKFENDFNPEKKLFPVHLLPCPEALPPLNLNKGLLRMGKYLIQDIPYSIFLGSCAVIRLICIVFSHFKMSFEAKIKILSLKFIFMDIRLHS